ncbi:MAG: sulfite exporter TauE/SafE family protein [Chloroflexi bacterium]|nr:sulfite exporter TauE/SafE family protein [Chloroflexota bacterium]
MGTFIDTVAGMGFGAFSSSIMVAGGIAPVLVVSTINLAKVSTGLVEGLSHCRFGNVRWAWVVPLGLPAIAGGIAGATLLTHLPAGLLRIVMPLILLGMGALILRRFLFGALVLPQVAGGSQALVLAVPQGRQRRLGYTLVKALPTLRLGGIGMAAGVLNGIAGVFGPFATSAVLLTNPGASPRYAIGTVNFVEFFVAAGITATLLLRVGWTGFQWQFPVALMAGALLTAPLGAYLCRRVPARGLGILVGVALVGLNTWSLVQAAT